MEYLKISNWEKWQTYRADRGQPPWIKIHRRVMRNPEWVSLTDAERGQLVAIWLLAADHNGTIPSSADVIQRLCLLENPPDLNKFTDLGFIEDNWRQDGVKMASTGRQHDAPEAEAKAEAEAEKNREDDANMASSCPQQKIIELYQKIIPEMPEVRVWNDTQEAWLRARWKEDPERQSLVWWERFFRWIRESDWLMGRTKEEFSCDLEWLIRKMNFAKIANGRYHRKKRGQFSGIDEWLKMSQEKVRREEENEQKKRSS